jgi:hypothetical protein
MQQSLAQFYGGRHQAGSRKRRAQRQVEIQIGRDAIYASKRPQKSKNARSRSRFDRESTPGTLIRHAARYRAPIRVF